MIFTRFSFVPGNLRMTLIEGDQAILFTYAYHFFAKSKVVDLLIFIIFMGSNRIHATNKGSDRD
jgi:hypothetical protein